MPNEVRTEPELRRPLWRELLSFERPLPPTPASRRLRALIALTVLATVVVEVLNLGYAEEGGFALAVRTGWALLRVLGWLVLLRTVRFGRMVARPFGLILAATTVFAVARLVVPRSGGLLPDPPVVVGFLVLAVLCGLVVHQLYRNPEIAAFLSRRPPRRDFPAWALTTRIAALSYSALLLVPCLVAAASLFGDRRIELAWAVPVVAAWFAVAIGIGFLTPLVTVFAVFGKGWARALTGVITVFVLVVQPVLCLLLLGVDGLLRDGAPLVIAAVLALFGLWRTRRPRPAVAG